MNHTAIKIYYFILIALSLTMVTGRIILGSQHVTHGQQLANLEKQRRVLVEQQRTLEQQLAHQTALIDINQAAATAGFEPTTHVLTLVDNSNQVAVR